MLYKEHRFLILALTLNSCVNLATHSKSFSVLHLKCRRKPVYAIELHVKIRQLL